VRASQRKLPWAGTHEQGVTLFLTERMNSATTLLHALKCGHRCVGVGMIGQFPIMCKVFVYFYFVKEDFMSHLKQVRVMAPLTVFVVVLTLMASARSVLVHANPSAMLVSGPSPFASCTIGGPGTNYVNAEVEPRVAVNPTNPSNIVGVFQQDRWSNGGAHGLVAGVSHDGGTTWSETWAHFSTCSGGTAANGGNYDRASDPWVSFAPNGDVYQIALSTSADGITSAISVSKSTNGGDTWSEPITLRRDSSAFNFNDKESITADPTSASYVYAVWDRSRFPSDNADFNALHSFAFRGTSGSPGPLMAAQPGSRPALSLPRRAMRAPSATRSLCCPMAPW
jgi:hypothetical protein